MLVAQGGVDGGYAFYVKDRKLHYAYNYLASSYFHVGQTSDVPNGRHELRFEFEPTGPAELHNGKGTPGTRSSTSTASWRARATCRSQSHSRWAWPLA